jgi:FtsZ-binding cell division protein ZapB
MRVSFWPKDPLPVPIPHRYIESNHLNQVVAAAVATDPINRLLLQTEFINFKNESKQLKHKKLRAYSNKKVRQRATKNTQNEKDGWDEKIKTAVEKQEKGWQVRCEVPERKQKNT